LVFKHIISMKKSRAFTLIESLVAMSMILILMAILVPFYQSFKAQLSLDRSASRLAQDVRRVMEKAMSAQEYILCKKFGGNYHNSYKYGYGIYITTGTTGSYILFADCDGNSNFNSGNDETIEQVAFESGIVINGLSRSNLFVIFQPPDPSVYITSGDLSANIILKVSTDNTKQKTININKVGLVDIN